MMDIYFDNSATTLIDSEVQKFMNDFSEKYFANPSAMHRLGYLVEEEVKSFSNYIAKELNCDAKEIIWTSGGSESNNLAISGYIDAHKKMGNKIITTKIEHSSVYNVFKKYEDIGLEVVYLDVDRTGHIDINDLQKNIDSNTILVSVMYINNEIGARQDIEQIGKVIKEANDKCAFHVDFVQGFAKYRVNVKKSKIDFLSVSSHKINGPKGAGFLYKNSSVRLTPLILGGEQQNGLRAGTLNTTGIAGTYFATKIAYESLEKNVEKLTSLRNYLIDRLEDVNKNFGIITVNTKKDDTFAPHIVSISFKGIRSEVMLHALEDKGIYVSAGSACSSHDKRISRTLKSIGLNDNEAESTIRVSFGKSNEIHEIDTFINVIKDLIPVLSIRKK